MTKSPFSRLDVNRLSFFIRDKCCYPNSVHLSRNCDKVSDSQIKPTLSVVHRCSLNLAPWLCTDSHTRLITMVCWLLQQVTWAFQMLVSHTMVCHCRFVHVLRLISIQMLLISSLYSAFCLSDVCHVSVMFLRWGSFYNFPACL